VAARLDVRNFHDGALVADYLLMGDPRFTLFEPIGLELVITPSAPSSGSWNPANFHVRVAADDQTITFRWVPPANRPPVARPTPRPILAPIATPTPTFRVPALPNARATPTPRVPLPQATRPPAVITPQQANPMPQVRATPIPRLPSRPLPTVEE
jgi:hypothetical protein